jgi:hypothetical protein
MKKSDSLSRICLVVCIIILIAAAIVTSPLGSLLPVFGFAMLLDLIPLIRGNRPQKIMAVVILAIAVTLFIFAIKGFKLQRQRMEGIRKTHVPQQLSAAAQSGPGFE